MKEYRIQMLRDGKWLVARTYFGSTLGNFASRSHAEQVMLSVEDAWQRKGSPDHKPDRFRLVARDVSEWEVCEE